jgi:hypothetical protein
MKLPTVIFSHPAWGFINQGEHIANRLRTIDPKHVTCYPNLPGHEGRPLPEDFGKLGIKDFAEPVVKMLKAKAYEGCILIGHSSGACQNHYAVNEVHGDSEDDVPDVARAQIHIAPAMQGLVSIAVIWTIICSWTYLKAMLTGKPIYITRDDAKHLIFNGEEHPWLDQIVRQPASGRLVLQFGYLFWLPRPKVSTYVIAAKRERMHLSNQLKRLWCWLNGAKYYEVDATHGGILEHPDTLRIIQVILESYAVHRHDVETAKP